MPHTRVYINMEDTENHVKISMKNISATELTFNPSEITERFVRGDASRNTEGSGLGLPSPKALPSYRAQAGSFHRRGSFHGRDYLFKDLQKDRLTKKLPHYSKLRILFLKYE